MRLTRQPPPSPRELVQADLACWLSANHARWTAPFGVLCGRHEHQGKAYRSVTFGIARALDAEVRIYSPSFMILRSSRRGNSIHRSLEALKAHLSSTEIF